MRSTICVTLLLVTLMVSKEVSAQGGISSCCKRLSNTQVHRDFLRSYYIQRRPACRLHAVVFTTLRNIRICSNPHRVWTMTSMAYLDGKNWQIQRANLHHH